MSSYAILQDVSRELRQRMFDALEEAPDSDLGFASVEQDITLAPPRDTMQGSPRLSLFLYHIEPDGTLRNQRPPSDGNDALRFPPFALNLRYLITPLDDEEDQNQLVLGRVLQFLHDHPMLESVNGTALGSSYGGASPELRLTFEPLSMEQLSHIWSALSTGYRLSITYAVRVVAVDSARPVTPARRVIDKHTVIGVMEQQGKQ